jgi:hypothetical protein
MLETFRSSMGLAKHARVSRSFPVRVVRTLPPNP